MRVRDEGWIPDIQKHRGQTGFRDGNKDTITLFLDNIPDNKDHLWLHQTFNKFGLVKDAFIPNRRSKRTGHKFGFVRYASREAARVAVARLNGVWVEKDRLFVKEASFGQNDRKSERFFPRNPVPEQRGKEVIMDRRKVEVREKIYGETRSYAQILKGESSKRGTDHKFNFSVKPIGNG